MQAQSLFPAYDKGHSNGVKSQLSRSFEQTDQFMLKLLFLHWVVASTVIAYAFSTYLLGFAFHSAASWANRDALPHFRVACFSDPV
jgi:hypothetical protein